MTGGAGFIGSHICERLLAEGYGVVCLDNFDPYYDPKLKRANVARLSGDLKLVEGDVCDLSLLKRLCKDVDVVFHEAAQAGVRASVEDPLKPCHVNIGGALNILKAATDSGVKKVINASSSSVYGKVSYMPLDEVHPTNPISPYGVSKLAAEKYMGVFSALYGIKTANLRYFTVYGPRMRPDLAISIFTKRALANEPIEIFGNGEKTRDFTYISDIVGANMLLLKMGEGDFNIGGGNRVSVNKLAEMIIRITDSKSKITHSGDKMGDVEHTWANVEKAEKELGWTPKVGLDEGLRNFIDYIKRG